MAAPCHRAPERPSVGHRTKRVNPYGAVGFLEVGPKRIRLNLGSRGGRFSRKRLKSDCVPLALLCKLNDLLGDDLCSEVGLIRQRNMRKALSKGPCLSLIVAIELFYFPQIGHPILD